VSPVFSSVTNGINNFNNVISDSYTFLRSQCPVGTRFALSLWAVVKVFIFVIHQLSINKRQKEERMKKLMIQLFVIGIVIAAYALPVLAFGGGGP
jgi:Na+/serine symporter